MLSQAKLDDSPTAPIATIGSGPTAAMIRGVTRDIPKMPRVSGRNARPVAIGPKLERALEVLHGEEEHRQLTADDEADRGEAAEPAPAAEQGGTQQRVRDPALGEGQQRDQRRAGDEAEDRARRGPAVLGTPIRVQTSATAPPVALKAPTKSKRPGRRGVSST